MEHGTVKFFNPAQEKRFGFIIAENGEEVFFHFGDGAESALGVSYRGELEVQYDAKKSPARDPRKGDRVVFERQSGRKGKGPKASPWAFEAEHERLFGLMKAIQLRPQHWAAPNFIAFERERTSGWFPTTYYVYYPATDEARQASLEIRQFDTLLLYKSGEVVVTGRTCWFNHKDQRVDYTQVVTGKIEEPVHGIVPADAPDGFYFWNGQKWETCAQVEVRATSVIIGRTETPAHYRFIGLRTTSGQLIPNQQKLVTSQEFFSIREVKTDEVTDLPVVETPVRKDGWFTYQERHTWCEPNLTEGFAPELETLLDRLDNAMIVKQRIAIKDDRLRVMVKVSGLTPYELEYQPGHSSGDPDKMFGYVGWPTSFLQHSPGRTYRVSTWGPELKSDPKWIRLMQLLAETPLTAGPVEEAMLAKTGGQFYLDVNGSVV